MSKYDLIVCDSGIGEHQKDIVNIIETELGAIDDNGHGSKVIDTLLVINKKFIIGSMKILDKDNSGVLRDLINALKECSKISVKVIVLAVSLPEKIENEELYSAVTMLYNQNKIIVSSVLNGFERSIPAIYSETIGVRCTQINNQVKFYNKSNEVQCIIPKCHAFVRSYNNKYDIFSGNSLATAIFSGYVCNLVLHGCTKKKELEDYLENVDLINTDIWRILNIYTINLEDNIRVYQIENIIQKTIYEMGYKFNDNIWNCINSIEGIASLVNELEKSGLKVNVNKLLMINYFKDIRTLATYYFLQED